MSGQYIGESIIEQGLGFAFDPKNGYNVEKPIIGEFGAMLGYSAQLKAAGIAHSFRQMGLEAEITIQSGRLNDNETPEQEEKPVDEWNVRALDLTIDIFQSRKALFIESVNSGALGFIKNAIKEYRAQEEVGDFTFSISLGNATADTYARQLFNRSKLGGDQLRVERYVLEHTQTIPDTYIKTIADSNILKIYSDFDVFEDEITNSELQKPCPDRLVTKLRSAFTNLIPSGYSATDYKWGFLKSASDEDSTANNKVRITTTYTLDLWSLFEYDPAT